MNRKLIGPTVCAILAFTGMNSLSHAQSNTPVFDYWTLMNARFYETNGGYLFDFASAAFPPEGDTEYAVDIVKASGDLVETVTFTPQPSPFPMFRFLKPNGGGMLQGSPDAGDFALVGKVGGKEVTRMPFTVRKEKTGDEFDPKTHYYREGPWKNMAILSSVIDKDSDGLNIAWWTRLDEVKGMERPQVTGHLMLNGKEVAVTRSPYVISSPNWQFFNHTLIHPQDSAKRAPFQISELKAQDGDYTLVLRANGEKVYKTYHVTVKGGEIARHPNSARDHQPRTEYLLPRMLNLYNPGAQGRELRDAYWISTD